MRSVFFDRVALAYVQGFGLKVSAPFYYERFLTPGRQTLTTAGDYLIRGLRMEIIILAVIAYVGYCVFKSRVFSKTVVATEIQKALRRTTQGSFGIYFHGDIVSEVQEYLERIWDKVEEVGATKHKSKKLKPHRLTIAAYSSACMAIDLRDIGHPNANCLMICASQLLEKWYMLCMAKPDLGNETDFKLTLAAQKMLANFIPREQSPLDKDIEILMAKG